VSHNIITPQSHGFLKARLSGLKCNNMNRTISLSKQGGHIKARPAVVTSTV
jgi:hypothetical protein